MKKEISSFIKENKIASISCLDSNNKPYCFHCFYVFDEENFLLFFKSSSNTNHSKYLLKNPHIAASILPNKIELIALKGIQITGIVLTQNFPDNINPEVFYHKKLPFALAKSGQVWCIQLETVKMTDNTNVFGNKLKWQKADLV